MRIKGKYPPPIKGVEFIYTLKCPLTNAIVYVGKTNNMRLRYNNHVKDFRGNIPIRNYLKKLIDNAIYPEMELLEICSASEGALLENYWICQFMAWGFNILNNRDGQEGLYKLSKESRNKISASLKGKSLPIAVIEKLGHKVCKYDLNGNFLQIYISEKDALRSNGIKCGIRSAIKRNRTAGGFRWKWYNQNYNQNIGEYTPPKADNSKAVEANLNPVVEVDSNGNILKRFNSIKEAEKITGIHNISAVCRGVRPHAQGRIFKYS